MDILAMTSRPAAPESEMPETDAELAKIGNYGAYPGTDGADGVTVQEDFEARVLGLCRSLERRLSLAQRALDEAQARIAELEKALAEHGTDAPGGIFG